MRACWRSRHRSKNSPAGWCLPLSLPAWHSGGKLTYRPAAAQSRSGPGRAESPWILSETYLTPNIADHVRMDRVPTDFCALTGPRLKPKIVRIFGAQLTSPEGHDVLAW